jgi:hypothetical protein
MKGSRSIRCSSRGESSQIRKNPNTDPNFSSRSNQRSQIQSEPKHWSQLPKSIKPKKSNTIGTYEPGWRGRGRGRARLRRRARAEGECSAGEAVTHCKLGFLNAMRKKRGVFLHLNGRPKGGYRVAKWRAYPYYGSTVCRRAQICVRCYSLLSGL